MHPLTSFVYFNFYKYIPLKRFTVISCAYFQNRNNKGEACKDGSTTTIVESYRVVDDVLVISGKDYVVNGKYSIEGKQMIFVAPEIRTVLEEIEEQV
jgi:hypothetical protein